MQDTELGLPDYIVEDLRFFENRKILTYIYDILRDESEPQRKEFALRAIAFLCEERPKTGNKAFPVKFVQ